MTCTCLFPRAVWFVMVAEWKQSAKIRHFPSPQQVRVLLPKTPFLLDCRQCVRATLHEFAFCNSPHVASFDCYCCEAVRVSRLACAARAPPVCFVSFVPFHKNSVASVRKPFAYGNVTALLRVQELFKYSFPSFLRFVKRGHRSQVCATAT
jgi:hypothetical protein